MPSPAQEIDTRVKEMANRTIKAAELAIEFHQKKIGDLQGVIDAARKLYDEPPEPAKHIIPPVPFIQSRTAKIDAMVQAAVERELTNGNETTTAKGS